MVSSGSAFLSEKKKSLVDLHYTSGRGQEETENILYLRAIENNLSK
jgi:hypothetical protein